MDWNDDLDIEVDRRAKQGRRARQSTDADFGSPDNILDSPELNETREPVRPKRTGGWADDALKLGKNKSTTNLIEQERFREQKPDITDDIPIIPDIDEIQDDILSNDVSQAPLSVAKRVTTYKELDSDLLKQSTFNQLGDINLSHLTRFMYPEKQVRDPDVTWTKESLFNELISDS